MSSSPDTPRLRLEHDCLLRMGDLVWLLRSPDTPTNLKETVQRISDMRLEGSPLLSPKNARREYDQAIQALEGAGFDNADQEARDILSSGKAIRSDLLTESEHDTTYAVTMSDGNEYLAKVIKPENKRRVLATVSEESTMRFAHHVLELPVPSATTEYNTKRILEHVKPEDGAIILMRRPNGVLLSSLWETLNKPTRNAVITSILNHQMAWTFWDPERIGAVLDYRYYEQRGGGFATPWSDCPWPGTINQKLAQSSNGVTDTWVAGPLPSRADSRYNMAMSHFGPYQSIAHYHHSLVSVETESFYGATEWEPTGDKYLDSIFADFEQDRKRCKAAAAYQIFLPHITYGEEALLRSALWNPNLRTDAIFVDPNNPTDITGFVDWRGTELAPLYKQTHQPPFHSPRGASKNISSRQSQFQKSIYEFRVERDCDGAFSSSSDPMIAASLNYSESFSHWLLENAETHSEDEAQNYLDRANEYVLLRQDDFGPGKTIDDLIQEKFVWKN